VYRAWPDHFSGLTDRAGHIKFRSPYCFVARLALLNSLEPQDTRRLFRRGFADPIVDSGYAANRRLFAALSHVLRATWPIDEWASAEKWLPLQSAGFGISEHCFRILRYCPVCLEHGEHFVAHQLPFVTRCEVHGRLLRIGCPRCNAQIPGNEIAAAVSNPFGCTACGWRACGCVDVLCLPDRAGLWRASIFGRWTDHLRWCKSRQFEMRQIDSRPIWRNQAQPLAATWRACCEIQRRSLPTAPVQLSVPTVHSWKVLGRRPASRNESPYKGQHRNVVSCSTWRDFRQHIDSYCRTGRRALIDRVLFDFARHKRLRSEVAVRTMRWWAEVSADKRAADELVEYFLLELAVLQSPSKALSADLFRWLDELIRRDVYLALASAAAEIGCARYPDSSSEADALVHVASQAYFVFVVRGLAADTSADFLLAARPREWKQSIARQVSSIVGTEKETRLERKFGPPQLRT